MMQWCSRLRNAQAYIASALLNWEHYCITRVNQYYNFIADFCPKHPNQRSMHKHKHKHKTKLRLIQIMAKIIIMPRIFPWLKAEFPHRGAVPTSREWSSMNIAKKIPKVQFLPAITVVTCQAGLGSYLESWWLSHTFSVLPVPTCGNDHPWCRRHFFSSTWISTVKYKGIFAAERMCASRAYKCLWQRWPACEAVLHGGLCFMAT